jgi:hypothetical protein
MTPEALPVATDASNGVVPFKPIRLENVKLTGVAKQNYQHAFLTDISGKGEAYEGVDFSYSVITRGYFHQARFHDCKFAGARFTDCNFRNAIFKDCDFRYADFSGTRIETDEILRSLPSEPNIRRELLQILRKNSLSLGDVASSRRFVIAEIDAKREHLRRAWRLDEGYYRKKYTGFRKQVFIGLKRLGFWLDSFLWGHGERLWKLPIAVAVFLFLAASVSTVFWISMQVEPTLSSSADEFARYFWYYLNLFLDVPYNTPSTQWFWVDAMTILARYLTFGILIAGLFRWLSHR